MGIRHLVGEQNILGQLGRGALHHDLKFVRGQRAPGGLLQRLLRGHGDGPPQPDGPRDVVPPLVAHMSARTASA